MKRKNNRRGFTMAELLIVVAIIGILSGVGFVAVQLHQKSLAQLEANSIAKEIFIAAQNHLTMAESQGYLGENVDYGTGTSYTKGGVNISENVYYVAVNGSGAFTATSILNQMLPFGAIDETVRTGGNYVIRYQANPARVLDVWYGKPKNESFKGGYTGDPAGFIRDTFGLVSEMNHNYGNGDVIGWYGGDEALASGVVLQAPSITVENAERLTVTVDTASVPNITGGTVSVKLIIEGETSGAMAAIPILPSQNHRVIQPDTLVYTEYVVTLDDITQAYDNKDGLHFAEINNFSSNNTDASGTQIDVQGKFIPGENIIVQAVAYSNDALASIEYSNEVTTNSLFADVVDASDAGVAGVTSGKVALISNIRHLENLDTRVSGLHEANKGKLTIAGAKQTVDLVWAQTGNQNAFTTKIEDASVYKLQETSGNGTAAGCFLPVNIDYPLVYDGLELGVAPSEGVAAVPAKCHSITGVKVGDKTGGSAFAGEGGLFGKVEATFAIQNLELVDFDIYCTGNAGALAGKVTRTGDSSAARVTIRNVLAHNSETFDKLDTATVTSTGGNAGGLVGEMLYCDMTNCAAALVVSSTSTSTLENAPNNAGGLVGRASGTITGCYSGGHTNDGAYSSETYNVTSAKGAAGGLVGDAGETHILNSYSTCSAAGNIVGGLVGSTTGLLEHCYATGLVNSDTATTAGAFAGSISTIKTPTDCHYFDLVNERMDSATHAISYLPAVGGSNPPALTAAQLSALDATVESYNAFSGARTVWEDAKPYDTTLKTLYPKAGDGEACLYNLKTVEQLGETVVTEATDKVPADFVATHYGDWPAPEILVINTKN